MVEQLKRRRSVEIFTSMKENRELMAKLAEEQGQEIEKDWEQQGTWWYYHMEMPSTLLALW